MKHVIFSIISRLSILAILAFLAGCDINPILHSYRPILPDPPGHWETVLGKPHWRLEWVDEKGCWRDCSVTPGAEAPGISPGPEWTTAIFAWPFWPDRDLEAFMMKPAGALYPWDVSGDRILLSWEGGVEAFFWKEMAGTEHAASAAEGRLPWFFDWLRFRDLLYESENIAIAVRQDPWLADWKEIARKTVQSGFDRRRIAARKCTVFTVPGMAGFWINSSPFALPFEVPPGGSLTLNVWDNPDTWVSKAGVLKCSSAGWVWRPFFPEL